MSGHDRQRSLERAREGDAGALGTLLDGYRPDLRGRVRGMSGGAVAGRLDDSDLVQSALLEAARCFARFQGTSPAELTAWLRRIALRVVQHALRDHLGAARRDATRERPLEEAEDEGPTPAEEADRAE